MILQLLGGGGGAISLAIYVRGNHITRGANHGLNPAILTVKYSVATDLSTGMEQLKDICSSTSPKGSDHVQKNKLDEIFWRSFKDKTKGNSICRQTLHVTVKTKFKFMNVVTARNPLSIIFSFF